MSGHFLRKQNINPLTPNIYSLFVASLSMSYIIVLYSVQTLQVTSFIYYLHTRRGLMAMLLVLTGKVCNSRMYLSDNSQ